MDTFDQVACFVLGSIALCCLLLGPAWFSTRHDRRRDKARKLLTLMSDGRPQGCKCPPNPGMNSLPCDNSHIGSKRCPLTTEPPAGTPSQLATINERLDEMDTALEIIGDKLGLSAPQPPMRPQERPPAPIVSH